MLQFGANTGLLFPGGPQPVRQNNFAVPNGLYGYYGFDTDCLDFVNNLAINLSPSAVSQRVRTSAYIVNATSSNTAGYTVISTTALPSSTAVYAIGIYRTTPQTFNVKIALANGGLSYTFVVSQSFSHGGTGWENCVLSIPYFIPATGNYSLGVYSAATMNECSNSTPRAYYLGDAVGTVTMLGADSGPVQGIQYTVYTKPDGILNNFTAASMVDGRIGQGLSFNGSSSYVDITNLNALNSQTQSVSLWLPNKGTNKTAYIISRCPNSPIYAYLGLFYESGNFRLASTSGYVTTLCTWASITNGDHLCLTLNYPDWVFYKNAVIVNSGTATVAFNNNPTVATTSIGRDGAYNDFYFDGVMDDLRIYDRPLDQGEVIELHKSGLAGRRDGLNNIDLFLPVLSEIAQLFVPAWGFQSNPPVIGAGTY